MSFSAEKGAIISVLGGAPSLFKTWQGQAVLDRTANEPSLRCYRRC